MRTILSRPLLAVAHPRTIFVAGCVLVISALALTCQPASAQQHGHNSEHWTATWGTAPAGQPLPADVQAFDNQTLRLIVHPSIGGHKLRIRLSNELGAAPLRIGAAHVALRASGAGIVPGSDRALTFSGMKSITVPPGAPVLSDPVELNLPAMADLSISLYLPARVEATTLHPWAAQTSYVSAAGDFTGGASFPVDHTTGSWPFLTEVDVASGGGAVVALGDSITDSASTKSDTNHRWPDFLAQRLRAAGSTLAVVNRGISGNRMLRDPGEQPLFGKAMLARFERDVMATAGAKYVIMMIGINDIGHPGGGKIPMSEEPTLDDLIAGYRQVIARAHAGGIDVYGATLTPFEDNTFAGFYSPEKEALRQKVNEWIRNCGEFDAVIDFDKALRDPAHPTRMLPAYDGGDHLHPNDRGTRAMANAVPLELFRSGAAKHR